MVNRTCGSFQDQLVDGHADTTGLCDSGASSFSEAESCNLELREFQNSHVICDSSDNDNSPGRLAAEVSDHLAEGDGGSHGSRRDQSSQDGLAEARISAS